jgi:hypothetical protein
VSICESLHHHVVFENPGNAPYSLSGATEESKNLGNRPNIPRHFIVPEADIDPLIPEPFNVNLDFRALHVVEFGFEIGHADIFPEQRRLIPKTVRLNFMDADERSCRRHTPIAR